MASPTLLTFDAEGRAVAFDVWLDDLQLFLQCDSRDGLSLFDITSGASTAPAADADSTVRSQWLTRDAAAYLAVRSHLPPTERAHFSQYKSAKTLYNAVVARYSSPATAALSRLMLPYLFLGKEALVMRKVSERRSNVNADAKVYGRGPGGCVSESKWHILVEKVAPSISRTPAEWCRFYEHRVYGPGANWHFCATSNRPFANLVFQLTLLHGLASKRATMLHVKIPTVGYILNVLQVEWPLVNARGRDNLPLDTAEAVNRQNVAHKIDQVVAWIAATYNAGDVAIWESWRPAGFNMGPRIKILVEGYERVIFPYGTPP
ncbi:unnamed protein product [Closterium sp. NIES-53]